MDPDDAPFRPGEETLPGPVPAIEDEVKVVNTSTEDAMDEHDRGLRSIHAETGEHTCHRPKQGVMQGHDILDCARRQFGFPNDGGDRVPAVGSHTHSRIDEGTELGNAGFDGLQFLCHLGVPALHRVNRDCDQEIILGGKVVVKTGARDARTFAHARRGNRSPPTR